MHHVDEGGLALFDPNHNGAHLLLVILLDRTSYLRAALARL